jgi:glyoxylase-like metal-dependent hydrolase (beta-lactamase superfamily II)
MKRSTLDRRQFLRFNGVALAGAALAPVVSAEEWSRTSDSTTVDTSVSPGFYRFPFGDMEITVLSDGHFDFPFDLISIDDSLEFLAYNADQETREEYVRSRQLPTDRVPLYLSPVLIDSGNQRTLVDSGLGPGEDLPPTAGRLGLSLEAAGIAPESIDQVLITHAHPDHLGGLIDPVSGAPLYPEAEVVLSEKERAFWMGDDATWLGDDATPDGDLVLETARTVLQGVDDHLRTVEGETEVVNGIWSIPSPGHSPGHVCYAIDSEGQQLLLTGDAIIFTHTSFEHPEWHVFVDADQDEAAQTRKRLLDHAATDEMFILGFHFPFPGLGYAIRDGDGYRWHPAGWAS